MGAGGPAGQSTGSNFAKAAANGTEAGSSVPWWQAVGNAMNKHSSNVRTNAESWISKQQTQMKNWKPPKGMPVHVDVDFLNPFAETVRNSAISMWKGLPPPVQQGLPYVTAGASAGFVIFQIQNRKLKAERAKNERLEGEVAELLNERAELYEKVKELRAKSLAPRSASEMKMASAVAEATSAAAAAASAAAQAASLCSTRGRASANQDFRVGPPR